MEERRAPRRSSSVLITERDRRVLEMAAEHRLIVPGQAAALLRVASATAASRLRALARGGYLIRDRPFDGQPSGYRISRSGLAVVGSPLSPPRRDFSAHAHDVALGWLWLAARHGTFGPMGGVLSERTLRSLDGRRAAPQARQEPEAVPGPLGIRLGGLGPGGRERLHHPDLLLITPEGRRIAVELELSAKGRTRRERILAGYGGDARIDAVLYLVDQPAVARSIQTSARRLGISAHVHVQWIRQPRMARVSTGRGLQRSAGPAPGRVL